MLGFIKKCFFTGLALLSTLTTIHSLSPAPLNAIPLSCISINNQECKVRPQIVNINGDDPVFFPYSIKTSKRSGRCNNINNSFAQLRVPDVVKNLNLKVFNLLSRTNETRRIEWHETSKCKCRFNSSVYNNKQLCNDDKCTCECKILTAKGVCDKGFIWSPSNREC